MRNLGFVVLTIVIGTSISGCAKKAGVKAGAKNDYSASDSGPRRRVDQSFFINLPGDTEADREMKDQLFRTAGYEFDQIIQGMTVTAENIQPFSVIDPSELDRLKTEYLARPEIQAISLERYLEYFDQSGSTLEYFDYSHIDDHGQPTRRLDLTQARQGIQTVINTADHSSNYVRHSTALTIRYALKRSLVFLDSHPERIPNALVVLASGGQHCSVGQTDAALHLERELFGNLSGLGIQAPSNFDEAFRQHLDVLREEVFLKASAFIDDSETGITRNILRNDLGRELGIRPSTDTTFSGLHYHGSGIQTRPELNELVRRRFFNGKFGHPEARSWNDSSTNPLDANLETLEMRRTHVGYTPDQIAGELIWISYKNQSRTGQPLAFRPRIDSLLVNADGISQIRTYALEHIRDWAALVSVDGQISEDEIELATHHINTALEEDLKREYTAMRYFTQSFQSRRILNSEAIRKIMIQLRVVSVM